MHSSRSQTLEKIKMLTSQTSEQALQEFFTFLQFASISSDPHFNQDVRACAEWLKTYISEIGFEVTLWEQEGHHPVIFASWNKAGKDAKTLLIYNHYDVQPVDPLDLWISPPFEPTIRTGAVYARGAQDNKGQCFYVLQAIKNLLALHGSLPLNIKLCIEGEEECGSRGLTRLLSHKQTELQADYLAVVDLTMKSANQPSITLGIRGILTMEVEARGSTIDLHSGSHGGIAYNPIHALVELLAQLRGPTGTINIPGFYDNVQSISALEKEKLNFEFDATQYAAMFGIKATGGEPHLPVLERNWLRPTLEINGICGGYTGQGFKTVIPAKASAKISCRLVPGQDPKDIGEKVAHFLKEKAPPGISIEVNISDGYGPAVRTDSASKIVKAFSTSFEEVYGRKCQYTLEGASIPIAAGLTRASKAELILFGLGLLDDAIHAPNEHFSLDRLQKGTLIIARALELLGA